MNRKVAERVRFAPSPTGFLHLGSLRTALYNYLIAHQTGGQFILRIEDTDQSRTVPKALEGIFKTLKWAGLQWDEGPGVEGSPHPPYLQSQRLTTYRQFAERLVTQGQAYRCDCPKRVEIISGPDGRYNGRCRNRGSTDSFSPTHVIRLRVPSATPAKTTIITTGERTSSLQSLNNDCITVQDTVYGRSHIRLDSIDDAVLLKSDGFPTYHLANIIDDHLMGITLVMRGCEWLPSTPLHLLLYEALGWQAPRFAHLPLLINSDGSKLSKRQNAAMVDYYKREGYQAEALLNFVAQLGWTPPTGLEVLSLKDMVNQFNLKDINRSDAKVDLGKLQWFNRQYLRLMISDPTRREDMSFELSDQFGSEPSYCARVLQLMTGRINTLHDVITTCRYFFERPNPPRLVEYKDNDYKAATLLLARLEDLNDFNAEELHLALADISTETQITISQLQGLLRRAITGQSVSKTMVIYIQS